MTQIDVIRKHIEQAELGEGHNHAEFETCDECEQAQRSIGYLQATGWQNAILLIAEIDRLAVSRTTQLPSPEPTNFVSDTSLPSCPVCGEIMHAVCGECEADTLPTRRCSKCTARLCEDCEGECCGCTYPDRPDTKLWISVAERLPTEGSEALIWDGAEMIVDRVKNGKFSLDNLNPPITHWMSLPQPPSKVTGS